MSKCEHPNPRPHSDQMGNTSVVCPDCKLSVSERQLSLVLAWSKKIEEMKAAHRGRRESKRGRTLG